MHRSGKTAARSKQVLPGIRTRCASDFSERAGGQLRPEHARDSTGVADAHDDTDELGRGGYFHLGEQHVAVSLDGARAYVESTAISFEVLPSASSFMTWRSRGVSRRSRCSIAAFSAAAARAARS